MEWSLLLAALGLGVAATPHCAVMCGAPCAALTQRGAAHATAHSAAFHAGRLIGYSAAGAVAASSIAALGAWAQAAPALRPLWTLLHLALLALGLWWMVTGQQPAWMLRRSAAVVTVRMPGVAAHARRTGRTALVGLAWVAWPCAALQGALLLAALASSAAGGALVMALFAIASMPGLAAAPWLWGRWRAWRGTTVAPGQVALLGFRGAGFGLVMVSGWALTQGIWLRFAAWCFA